MSDGERERERNSGGYERGERREREMLTAESLTIHSNKAVGFDNNYRMKN